MYKNSVHCHHVQAADFKKEEVCLYIPLCKQDSEAKNAAEQMYISLKCYC